MTRRYSDDEVKLILRRALESDVTLPATHGEGLSLEQIREVAADVGIDPGRVDLAAASVAAPVPAPPNPYAGIPTSVQFETTLPGLTLDDVPWHDVLAVIRSVLGRQGVTESAAGSLEWRARDASGGRYVSIAPTAGGVRLRVLGNYRDGLTMVGAAVGMAGLTIGTAVLSSLGLDSVAGLLVAGALAAVPPRFVYRWWRTREDTGMALLYERLVTLLGERPGSLPAPDDPPELPGD